MLLVALVALAVPMGTSYWAWQDAKRRRMSTRWAISVGLALIIFLPIDLLVRKTGQMRILWKGNPDRLCIM